MRRCPPSCATPCLVSCGAPWLGGGVGPCHTRSLWLAPRNLLHSRAGLHAPQPAVATGRVAMLQQGLCMQQACVSQATPLDALCVACPCSPCCRQDPPRHPGGQGALTPTTPSQAPDCAARTRLGSSDALAAARLPRHEEAAALHRPRCARTEPRGNPTTLPCFCFLHRPGPCFCPALGSLPSSSPRRASSWRTGACFACRRATCLLTCPRSACAHCPPAHHLVD